MDYMGESVHFGLDQEGEMIEMFLPVVRILQAQNFRWLRGGGKVHFGLDQVGEVIKMFLPVARILQAQNFR